MRDTKRHITKPASMRADVNLARKLAKLTIEWRRRHHRGPAEPQSETRAPLRVHITGPRRRTGAAAAGTGGGASAAHACDGGGSARATVAGRARARSVRITAMHGARGWMPKTALRPFSSIWVRCLLSSSRFGFNENVLCEVFSMSARFEVSVKLKFGSMHDLCWRLVSFLCWLMRGRHDLRN